MGGIISAIFGGGQPAPAPQPVYMPAPVAEPVYQPAPVAAPVPLPEPPKATPIVDEVAVAAKQKQAVVKQRQTRGRSSTILSDAGNGLGTSDTLG